MRQVPPPSSRSPSLVGPAAMASLAMLSRGASVAHRDRAESVTMMSKNLSREEQERERGRRMPRQFHAITAFPPAVHE